MRLRVAAAQIPVTEDIAANEAAISRAIGRAVAERAEVLVTPEGSLSGYTHTFDDAAVAAALARVTARARAGSLGLALGTCFHEADGRCYNQLRFYERDGRFLGFHSKILTCGTLEDPPRGEIEVYAQKPLETFAIAGVPIGGLICNDMWANPICTPVPDPHLTQQLSRRGARVVLHGVNGGRSETGTFGELFRGYHESNLRARALAGKLWIVTADNAHPAHVPVASAGGVIGPDGEWVVRMSITGEQYCAHTIELD